MTEGDKFRLKRAGKDFMDITDYPELGLTNASRNQSSAVAATSSSLAQAETDIKAYTADLDDSYLRSDIAELSGFWTRAYFSPWGHLSSNWIYDHANAVSVV